MLLADPVRELNTHEHPRLAVLAQGSSVRPARRSVGVFYKALDPRDRAGSAPRHVDCLDRHVRDAGKELGALVEEALEISRGHLGFGVVGEEGQRCRSITLVRGVEERS